MKQILFILLLLPIYSDAQIITTIVGKGTVGFSGDGGLATMAEISYPRQTAFDRSGNLYITDRNNQRIRKVTPSGIISTIVGSGMAGYSGDGGPATMARITSPSGVVVDSLGNVYLCGGPNTLRKVDTAGIITTFAGTGTNGFSGDGGPATAAQIYDPQELAIDRLGNIYFADVANQRIRMVNTLGIISTVAGNGTAGFSGDGGAATLANLNFPEGVSVDESGNIYIAEVNNNRIRKVNMAGIISTVAGNGTSGFSGDIGPATAAEISEPTGVRNDKQGNLYIADANNSRIRKVDGSGIITTIAGNGIFAFAGDGGPATAAELNASVGVNVDAAGNVYISDWNNSRVRKLSGGVTTNVYLPHNSITNARVFPNPATTALTITSTDKITSIAITNLIGQTVYSNSYHNEEVQVVVADLPEGMYLIKINGTEVKKFVKQ